MDTFIVCLLRRGGCSQKQAAAFERWLEDETPAGIGPWKLGQCIRAAILSDCQTYVSALREVTIENERLLNELHADLTQSRFDGM
jgi:hypothetical protein